MKNYLSNKVRFQLGGKNDKVNRSFTSSPSGSFGITDTFTLGSNTGETIPGEEPGGSDEFQRAFAEARKRGDDTFEFKGKYYSTELAGDKQKVLTKERNFTLPTEPNMPGINLTNPYPEEVPMRGMTFSTGDMEGNMQDVSPNASITGTQKFLAMKTAEAKAQGKPLRLTDEERQTLIREIKSGAGMMAKGNDLLWGYTQGKGDQRQKAPLSKLGMKGVISDEDASNMLNVMINAAQKGDVGTGGVGFQVRGVEGEKQQMTDLQNKGIYQKGGKILSKLINDYANRNKK